MSRKEREKDELKRASDHLHYEFWMLNSLANALASGFFNSGPMLNALLESFAIHVRALIDFLYAEKPKGDDVIAEDYFLFSKQRWEDIRPLKCEVLKKAKRRAHKEIVHLTYARLSVTPETKPWLFLEITHEINKIVDIFYNNVNKELLGERWRNPIIITIKS